MLFENFPVKFFGIYEIQSWPILFNPKWDVCSEMISQIWIWISVICNKWGNIKSFLSRKIFFSMIKIGFWVKLASFNSDLARNDQILSFSVENDQISADPSYFWSFLIENGDFEHFPDRDNSYLGCENECKLSLTLLIIISNLTRS